MVICLKIEERKQMIEDKMIVIQKVVEEELIGEKHLNKYLRKNKFNIKKDILKRCLFLLHILATSTSIATTAATN